MTEDVNYDTGDHFDNAMDASYPRADTGDAARGLAQAKEDNKMSNKAPGNVQVRMRGQEQFISKVKREMK